MKIDLLRRIQAKIAEVPDQFQMACWFLSHFDTPNCGTAACIGGWAIALSGEMTPRAAEALHRWEEEDEAIKALGLTCRQSGRLFCFAEWPSQFKQHRLDDADQAVARIEHFIKTKGRE